MNAVIMPIERLISECDNLYFESKKCCFTGCSRESIVSHTIAENYLSKLNQPLTKVLTFQPRIGRIVKKYAPQYVMKIDKSRFSTFKGFCESHDNDLFKLIDNFNGEMDKEKAALVHYRNICYGIYHIKTQQLREKHLAQQNYTYDASVDEGIAIKELLEKGHLKARLAYCLQEHLSRKALLEKIMNSGKFEEVEFIEIKGDLNNNPIFSGRSGYLLHRKHRLFDHLGYSSMPWITYQTLLTTNCNHLVFCWLKKDRNHSKYFKKILRNLNFESTLAALAYSCSDSLAVTEDHYNTHIVAIDTLIKEFRVY
ncbi:hypothetical protein [Legionella nagasakiensis]|uniref:hypothetical protein n=1 Tax=Legionella nagasakiensis TaxID=535290 RepID=UPI00105652D1|nr:hypothetical protein [Legionella nagasakiensis]